MIVIWYHRVHKMPIYITLSYVDTMKLQVRVSLSTHKREYIFGRHIFRL